MAATHGANRTRGQSVFFRFISAIVLVVFVSMGGVLLEKRILELRRDISRQQYRTDILLDRHTSLRLRTQQLSAPGRISERDGQHHIDQPQQASRQQRTRGG